MRKLFPVVFVLLAGTTIAIVAKANKSPQIYCCDEFPRKCAVIDGQEVSGPSIVVGQQLCP